MLLYLLALSALSTLHYPLSTLLSPLSILCTRLGLGFDIFYSLFLVKISILSWLLEVIKPSSIIIWWLNYNSCSSFDMIMILHRKNYSITSRNITCFESILSYLYYLDSWIHRSIEQTLIELYINISNQTNFILFYFIMYFRSN